MKLTISTLLLSAALASGAPTRPGPSSPPARAVTRRDDAITDTQIVQFALGVENLENAFYTEALGKFDEAAFKSAGFPPFVRGRFAQLAANEAQHVKLLKKVLGNEAPAPCNYSFPYHDPKSFAALSSVFEGVGVSAYSGALSLISDKTIATVAGTILSVEARNQAWVHSSVIKQQPWNGPEDTPLSFNQVLTLATPFIVSCPSTNPELPFKPFPPVTASVDNAPSGTEVTYTFNATAPGPYYAAYLYGITLEVVPLSNDHKAKVPGRFLGRYYTVITTSADGNITDANTVAGPLLSVVDFPFSTVF